MVSEYNATINFYRLENQKLIEANKILNESIWNLSVENEKLKKEIREIKSEKNRLSKMLERARKQIREYRAGYIRRAVSKEEVLEFLRKDDTDSYMWTEDFDCTQFANRLVQNALEEGMLACVVEIDFPDGTGHDIVVFNTTEGLLYIEPQTDEIVYPVIGEPYWDRSVYEVDYNDTIIKYTSCFGEWPLSVPVQLPY